MNSVLRVIAWGGILLLWFSVLRQLWVIPLGSRECYDPSPSSIFVHLSGSDLRSHGLRSQSHTNMVINSSYAEVTTPYDNYQASGYNPAPIGSIIINPRSYRALYFAYGPMPVVRHHLLGEHMYSDFVPEFVSCEQHLDVDARLILHCYSANVTTTSFPDILRSFVKGTIQRLGIAVSDMSSRILVLCVDLSVRPSSLVRRLSAIHVRNLVRKHDYLVLNVSSRLFCPSHTCITICAITCGEARRCYKWWNTICDAPIRKMKGAPNEKTNTTNGITDHYSDIGGGINPTNYLTLSQLLEYKTDWSADPPHNPNINYKLKAYMVETHARTRYARRKDVIVCICPLSFLVPKLTVIQLRLVATHHNIFVGARWSRSQIMNAVSQHKCNDCSVCVHFIYSGIQAKSGSFPCRNYKEV